MGQPSVDYWFNRLLRTIDGLQKVVFVKISWRNMYGPPPNCKKNRVDENSLRKCIRPLSGEWSPGA